MRKALVLYLIFSAAMLGCTSQVHTQQKQEVEMRQKRLQVAEAMFQERCKKSGEKIYRTVDNVEGIFLLKVRPDRINYSAQFEMDDPYGRDLGGDGYIKIFLMGRNANGSLTTRDVVTNGYRYIDFLDPSDGKRYRYTASFKNVTHTSSLIGGGDGVTKFITRDFVLERNPTFDAAPRYAATYDDISTLEDRQYWIAGGSLKIIDLRTNEVIAERIGYMMDRGQGDDSGARSPWLLAAYHACPRFPTTPDRHPFKMHQTRDFVEKVLSIKSTN